MERKRFLAAAAMASAAFAAVGVAANGDSASTGNSGSSACQPGASLPRPSGSPHPHTARTPVSEVESAERHVERVVQMLQRDPNDYGGHKAPAIAALLQASGELQQAVAYNTEHPTAAATP